jgi:proteasome lid subunit RPN8/RPN11
MSNLMPDGDAASIVWTDLATTTQAQPAVAVRYVRFLRPVMDSILSHVGSDVCVEMAGLLFGRFDAAFGTIVLEAHAIAASAASLTHVRMHRQAWPHIWSAAGRRTPELAIVGWYHSHPGHGVYLSETDRRTQAAWFRRLDHIALVIDPVRKQTAAFCGPSGVQAEIVYLDEA